MVSHTYHIHLESATIQLPNVDDLLGKDVEVIIRELTPADQASPDFFKQIEDPSTWQKQLRDEWE